MDVTNIILTLQNKINESPNSLNNLIAIKALNQLKTGNIRYVDRFADLPPVSTSTGSLYLVTGESMLYWSTGDNWLPIVQTSSLKIAFAWGNGTCGATGTGSTADRCSPVSLSGGYVDWCQVSAGTSHGLSIRSDGSLWAWGLESSGQLGNNSGTGSESIPLSVVGGITDWCDVSAGDTHSLGIRSDGTAWAWGSNVCGRLGTNNTTNRSSPVSVIGSFNDWCDISAGGYQSHGIRSNGTLWSWGRNTGGQLGDGTVVNKSSPVQVCGGFADWCQVSAGAYHTLALRTNGTAWAWGCNCVGRLGDNTASTHRSSPFSVIGNINNWCQVSAGNFHSLALRADGTAWAWGNNAQGRLGTNNTTCRSSPVSVVGGFTDWCLLSAGGGHSLGLRTGGTLWSWGAGTCGVLGNGSTVSRISPEQVCGDFTNWCQVSAGFGTTSFGIRVKDI